MMVFMGFDRDQLKKATDYYNTCTGKSLAYEDVLKSAYGLPMPGEETGQYQLASEVALFWRTRRIDMPNEVQIELPVGFWGRA